MYYIGVDIGGMSIKVGLVEEGGKLIAKGSFVTRMDQTAESVINSLGEYILAILRDYKLDLKKDIVGIGIGIPGTIHKNIVVYSNNLDWHTVPIVSILSENLKYPIDRIFSGNDANVAILGEKYCGVCKGVDDCIIITLGTGVGTGIVSGGQLIEGNGSCGAEGGHMVINPNGVKCTCGRKGCFEVYSSATALIRMTKEAIQKHPDSQLAKLAASDGGVTGKTLFIAMRNGDKVAKRLVDKYFGYIAIGITNIANILRPEIVVLGGGVSNEGEWFINAIQKLVDKEIYGAHINPKVIIKKASLGNDAGIIGAASLAMHNLK